MIRCQSGIDYSTPFFLDFLNYSWEIDMWWRTAGNRSIPPMDAQTVLTDRKGSVLGTVRSADRTRADLTAPLLPWLDVDEPEASVLLRNGKLSLFLIATSYNLTCYFRFSSAHF